jgi:hypothetical protein
MTNVHDQSRTVSRAAKEAEQQAGKIHDTQLKEGFLEVARQWRELAEQAERHELP